MTTILQRNLRGDRKGIRALPIDPAQLKTT
jgi:hypothetical protein